MSTIKKILTGAKYFFPRTQTDVLIGFTLIVAALTVGVYVAHFALVPDSRLSNDPEDWAAFGDYLGGILNPIVAFSALMLLARSVGIQKRELAETKRAIQEQARHAEDMVRLNATVVVLDAVEKRLVLLKSEYEQLRGAMPIPDERAKEVQIHIKQEEAKKAKLLNEVESLLKLSPLGEIARYMRATYR